MFSNPFFTDLLFYAVAGAILLTAVLVVTVKNVLQSAVFLIFSFIGTAVLYLMLHAEFIAMVQVMVYAGGVVIFMVFTILLTSHLGETSFSVKAPRMFIAFVFSAAFLGIMTKLLLKEPGLATAVPNSENSSSLASISMRLLNIGEHGFVIPFEIISILLLITLVCSITIARKEKGEK